jgi:hypothetical protein
MCAPAEKPKKISATRENTREQRKIPANETRDN